MAVRSTSRPRKTAAKRPASPKKKPAARIVVAKRRIAKPVAKRAVTRKAPVRRTVAKKSVTARRTTAKRAPAKKVATRKSVARKAPARRPAAARRTIAARKAPARKPVKATRKPAAGTSKNKVGTISHFFNKIGVAVIETSNKIQKGERVSIEGSSTNFKQMVRSMQHNNKTIAVATRGKSIGLKVNHKVRRKDIVYRI